MIEVHDSYLKPKSYPFKLAFRRIAHLTAIILFDLMFLQASCTKFT